MAEQPETTKDNTLPNFDALWDYDHPDQTEAKFREILQATRANHADSDCTANYLAELLTQIARAQGLQGKFDDGHRTLDQVDAMTGDFPPRVKIRSLLERGRLFNSVGDIARAAPPFISAFEIAQSVAESSLAIDAAHMLGICQPPDEAIEWNLRALAAAETATDPKARGWQGPLLNNLGWTYHDRKEFGKAMEFFEKALAFRKQMRKTKQIRIAVYAIARTHRSMGNVAKAMEMQSELHQQWQADGAEDGYVLEELGECALQLGRDDTATWFAAAYRILSADPWLVANESKRLERLKDLGNV